ncbi:hypothetical protein FM120_25800 [Sphingobacterium faecium PCAi_F2.5]|nr:hypothetical protein FM120_25800 [Sphingobacterium faecium PCAi_F2.5]
MTAIIAAAALPNFNLFSKNAAIGYSVIESIIAKSRGTTTLWVTYKNPMINAKANKLEASPIEYGFFSELLSIMK